MKKFLALLTLVCLAITAAVAFASFPSKTAQDMTTATLETADGAPAEWDVFVTEPSEEIVDIVKAMREHVAGESVVTFFGEDIQDLISAAMPEAVVDAIDLVAYELVPVALNGYKPEFGDANVSFTFATPFAEKAELTVLLGIPRAGAEPVADTADVKALVNAYNWTAQKCVVEDGKVKVLFTQAELTQMQDKVPALLIVLGAPIE